MPDLLVTFPEARDREDFIRVMKMFGADSFGLNIGEIDGKELTDEEELKMQTRVKGLFNRVVSNHSYDPPIRTDSERKAAIFVSGQNMIEGTVESLRERFKQECGSHSASVELREQTADGWKVVQSRRKQL